MNPAYFLAVYEGSAKLDAALAAQGLDADEGDNVHELATSGRCDERKRFSTLDAAVAWASKSVADKHTVFGIADVIEIEEVPPRKRCRYCVCDGRRRVRSVHVDETGIVEEIDEDDRCSD